MDTGRLPSVGEAFERAPSCNRSLLALCLTPASGPLAPVSAFGPRAHRRTADNRNPRRFPYSARSRIGSTRERGASAPWRNDVPTGTSIGGLEASSTTWFRSKRRGAELSAPEEGRWSRQQPRAAGFRTAARSRFDGRQEHRLVGTCSEAS